jgi:WD40 repeat protein
MGNKLVGRRLSSLGLVLVGVVVALSGLADHPVAHSQDTARAVRSVDWSPDGEYLAVGYSGGTVQVLNASTREPLAVFQLPGDVGEAAYLAWSPDGNQLAIGAFNGLIYFWHKDTGDLGHFSDNDQKVTSVTWSPDGTRLASTNVNLNSLERYSTKVWDVATGEVVFDRPANDGVEQAAWSPDGRWLALAETWTLTVLDTTIWAVELELSPPGYGPDTVDWSPDSTRLVSRVGGYERGVAIWSLEGDLLLMLPDEAAGDARWSPDGTKIAILGRKQIRVIDPATGQDFFTIPVPGSAIRIRWSPDGNELGFGDLSGNVIIADAVAPPTETPVPVATLGS